MSSPVRPYDRIWAEPMRTVARCLCVSDVALVKACRTADFQRRAQLMFLSRSRNAHRVRSPQGLEPHAPNRSSKDRRCRGEDGLSIDCQYRSRLDGAVRLTFSRSSQGRFAPVRRRKNAVVLYRVVRRHQSNHAGPVRNSAGAAKCSINPRTH